MALSAIQIKMVRRLLQSGNESKIAHALEKIHPSDLTILFSEISPNELNTLINSLFLLEKAGKTLRELPDFMIPDVLELIDDRKLAVILSRLDSDDALFLMEKVPESRWRTILDLLPESQRHKLDKLLIYPHNSAGSVMNSNFVAVKADLTSEQAIEDLRKRRDTGGDAFYIYVVDEGNRLVGVLSLRNLVLSPANINIRDIMNQKVYAVLATASQEEVAQLVSQYNLLAIPVVSENRELLGVITVDDVIDIIEEEATEDIYHLAGLSGVDRALTPLGTKVKKRLPWMILNLFTATLAASVIDFFSDTIEQVVALAVFMPIIAGVGGNGAIQSLTVIGRSIALGELSFIRGYKAILKETANGLIIGLICGLAMGLFGTIVKGNPYLGLVLFIAMSLNLIMGGLMGASVPILFKKLKLDPAVGTTVLVTMVTDMMGFFFFLGLATLMLDHLK